MNQSREALLAARPLHSPEGAWSRMVAGPSGLLQQLPAHLPSVGGGSGEGVGSIGGDDDAGGGWGRLDEVEPGWGKAVGEQPVSGAEDERVDREHVLVDEAGRAELLDERTTAHDVEVVAWSLLELGDAVGMSPLSSVVLGQGRGSVRVVEARYLGAWLRASRNGLS